MPKKSKKAEKRRRWEPLPGWTVTGTLTEAGLEVVRTLFELGFPSCEVCELCNLDKGSVSRLRKKWELDLPHGRNYGSPQDNLSTLTRRFALIAMVETEPNLLHDGAAAMRRRLYECGITAAASTVERDLYAVGFRHYWRPFCPHVGGHEEARVTFAKMASHLNPASILFSDESLFGCNNVQTGQWALCLDEVEPVERKRWTAVHHCWGVIGVGVKKLVFLSKDRVTADLYQATLERHLLPIYTDEEHKTKTFMQDNAPAHSAKSTKEFLLEKGIPVLSWPSSSPDLNPIENLWAIVKRKIRVSVMATTEELKEVIQVAWRNVPQSVVDDLVMSFHRRTELVIEKEGAWIGY